METESPNSAATLTQGPVGKTLVLLTGPMVLGFVSLMLFNLVDTLWLSRLGPWALAAIGFTFPITFVVISILVGLGIGVAAILSRGIGKGRFHLVKAQSTLAMILAIAIGIVLAILGSIFKFPILSLLGAEGEILTGACAYIQIWFNAMVLVAIPIMGSAILRANGNTKVQGWAMFFAAVVNGILDPFFIFGIGPFPELGMKGAAVSTAIAWCTALIVILWFLSIRMRLMGYRDLSLTLWWRSWRSFIIISLPAIVTQILVPVSTLILTVFLAQHSANAVAAYAGAGRIESLAFVVVVALGGVLVAFIGQNLGANRQDRVHKGVFAAIKFVVWFEGIITVILMGCAIWIALGFTENAEVRRYIRWFLWTTPVGYLFWGVAVVVSSAFNGMKLTLYAMVLNLVRAFILLLPFVWIGSHLFGVEGVFIGATLANILTGIIGYFWIRHFLLS